MFELATGRKNAVADGESSSARRIRERWSF
jgi:hypothetical protein